MNASSGGQWTTLPGMTWGAQAPRDLADRAIAVYWARDAHRWSRRFGRVGDGLVLRYAGELLAWLQSGTPGDEMDGYLRRVALSMAGDAAKGKLSAAVLIGDAEENYGFIRQVQPARRLDTGLPCTGPPGARQPAPPAIRDRKGRCPRRNP